MGSVGFDGESESQPSTSNSKKFKLPRKLLDACGAVNHASVPRKLRSAIKKRGRESITPPLPIPMKQNGVVNGVERLRKSGAKKSKLNMKQGFITKDEEEVAETLNSLADMFCDATKTNKPMFNGEPSKTKSSTKLEEGCSMTAAEDAWTPTLPDERRKSDTRITLETACHSLNLKGPMAQVVKFKSLGDSKHPEFPFSKQSDVYGASGVESDLSLGPRPKMSILDMIPSEPAVAPEQVPPSGVQYCHKDDKNNGSFLWASMSSTGALSSETQGSCKQNPAWVENTNCASQHCVIEKCDSYDKIQSPLSVVEPKKSWKRCSAHVYISRLIKVLQISEKKEGLLENPTQLTASGGVELGPNMNIDNQKREINGTNGVMSSDVSTPYSAAEKNLTEIQNAILLHKSLLQEQQASKTNTLCSSFKQGSDFLYLAAGGCGLDASDGINRAGHSHNAQKQCLGSYLQSQNHSTMLLSQPESCYSMFHGRTSAVAAQQVQLPPFLSSNLASSLTDPTGQHWESQQQLWTAPFSSQHYPAGVSTPHLPNWQIGERNAPSQLNYTQALFPHLHSALSAKYQQVPQQQLITMNSSLALTNVKRHTNRLPLGFERNGATCYPDNRSQLQLLCNQQHLRNG